MKTTAIDVSYSAIHTDQLEFSNKQKLCTE